VILQADRGGKYCNGLLENTAIGVFLYGFSYLFSSPITYIAREELYDYAWARARDIFNSFLLDLAIYSG